MVAYLCWAACHKDKPRRRSPVMIFFKEIWDIMVSWNVGRILFPKDHDIHITHIVHITDIYTPMIDMMSCIRDNYWYIKNIRYTHRYRSSILGFARKIHSAKFEVLLVLADSRWAFVFPKYGGSSSKIRPWNLPCLYQKIDKTCSKKTKGDDIFQNILFWYLCSIS